MPACWKVDSLEEEEEEEEGTEEVETMDPRTSDKRGGDLAFTEHLLCQPLPAATPADFVTESLAQSARVTCLGAHSSVSQDWGLSKAAGNKGWLRGQGQQGTRGAHLLSDWKWMLLGLQPACWGGPRCHLGSLC